VEASPMSVFEQFIKEAYGSQYVIPVYQRNYTWKKSKQVKQLLFDIEQILCGNKKRHFIGTIVYVIVKTNFMVRERAIVDGQQRLITMFLITYALRNIALNKNENKIAEALNNNYLENVTGDEQYKYRLQPSVSDDDAYSYIAAGKIDEYTKNSRVMENYRFIYKELELLCDKYTLMDVINAVRALYIVRIELAENDDAQQIFESINSTGEKLTAADLIRNYIMMNKSNSEQEKIYKEYWLELEKIFPESKKMAEFFRFYLAGKTYTLTTEKELYGVFKEYWGNKILCKNYVELLDDIKSDARRFKKLYLSQKVDELGVTLQDYRKLQSFMPAPFMMVILEHYENKKITEEQTLKIFKLINTYLVRRYIAGQDTSAISRFFPGYLKSVETRIEEEKTYENIVGICKYYLVNENKGKAAFMPDDSQIKTFLQTANAYSLSNIRWVLDKIETEGNPAPVVLSSLNIEHIMPQTQNEYWKKISGLEVDDYIKTVNRIGNLTLAAASDNSKMGNSDFEHKKIILASTKHLKLNESILKKKNWTIKDINERTKALTEKIIQIFPYPTIQYSILGKEKNRYITLNAKGINAMGYLNNDNTLTIYADSQIKFDVLPNSESLKELRENFIEQEIIVKINGNYYFSQNYTFKSPSTATDFILGGSNNGWLYWKDADDKIINESLRNL